MAEVSRHESPDLPGLSGPQNSLLRIIKIVLALRQVLCAPHCISNTVLFSILSITNLSKRSKSLKRQVIGPKSLASRGWTLDMKPGFPDA